MIFGYKEDEDTHGFFSLEYIYEPKENAGLIENYFNCIFDSPKNGKKIELPINKAWGILCDMSSNFNIPEKGLYTLFFKDVNEKINVRNYINLSLNEYEKEAKSIITKANQVIEAHAFSTLTTAMTNRKVVAEKQLEDVNNIRLLLRDDGYGI